MADGGHPGSRLKAFLRLSVYFGFTVVMMPIQLAALSLGAPAAKRIPHWYHGACCKLLGVEVRILGQPSGEQPTLFACNHSSYLDITVLGSLVFGSFIAKSEVASWPLFGWLARLQRTVFVERRRTRVDRHRDQVIERLSLGDHLILFAEGTSNDGNRVLPFKSSLFAVAEQPIGGRELTVQPVSIAYTELDGLPLGRFLRPFFAWYGDMDLAPHMWQLVGLGRVTVVVEFHRPVRLTEFGSRKALSDHCYRTVMIGVASALSGRPQNLAAMPAAA